MPVCFDEVSFNISFVTQSVARFTASAPSSILAVWRFVVYQFTSLILVIYIVLW